LQVYENQTSEIPYTLSDIGPNVLLIIIIGSKRAYPNPTKQIP